MSQVTSSITGSPVAGLPEAHPRNNVIYYSQSFSQTVETIPPEIQPTRTWEQPTRTWEVRVRDSTQASSLSTQWMNFQRDLQTASSKVQKQFFKLCASLAPEPVELTDDEWHNRFRELSDAEYKLPNEGWQDSARDPSRTTKYISSPLLIHLLLAAVRKNCAGADTLFCSELLQRSANENLSELRKLLGITEKISYNKLDFEDRTVLALPIAFGKEVCEGLPVALINGLPLKTVSCALNLIDKTLPPRRNPDNAFRMFLCRCAVSQESGNSIRKWMVSEEGKHKYLQAKDSLGEILYQEELAFSLATLRCYEMLLGNDKGSRPAEPGSWMYTFTMHANGRVPEPLPNLWQVTAASFRLACSQSCQPNVLTWLDAVLDDTPSADQSLQSYWKLRVAQIGLYLRDETASNERGSQPMQRQVSQRGYCNLPDCGLSL